MEGLEVRPTENGPKGEILNIKNLFPIPLGIFKLDREFTKKEISFIKNLETRDNIGNLTSKNTKVLENAVLKNLHGFILNSLDQYFQEVYAPKQDVKLRITQSWCNFTDQGKFHHKHFHPNSLVSGVFYIQTSNSDKINFYKARDSVLRTPTDNWNEYNSVSWWMEAHEKIMYLFPSDLEHSVETTIGEMQRISLSFNTFPVGNWGDENSLTGLNL